MRWCALSYCRLSARTHSLASSRTCLNNRWSFGLDYRRGYSTKDVESTYYSYFPQTVPSGPPPRGSFAIDIKRLRREFLQLQSKTHPDLARTEEERLKFESASSQLNKAYSTLSGVLTRALYLLELNKKHIAEDSGRTVIQDPELLAEVYEILERIEECTSEDEVKNLEDYISGRVLAEENGVEHAFETNDLDVAKDATIRLKYWVNIREALKEWEPGQPFKMVH
ncbi:hypothetical protein V1514DRAFT_330566 [Lipomyces japonicus]|uniref:uncharacterized protein n=1 Tax=Lipomyces japonicus TaxID=56871 RepID=UPI0034CE606E